MSLKIVTIHKAAIKKVNAKYAEYNLGDGDKELTYDDNTVVIVEVESPGLIEYPEENKYPPWWKDFSDLCKDKIWEKHLG